MKRVLCQTRGSESSPFFLMEGVAMKRDVRIRKDAWTADDDLVLAEVVLRHIREGSTQVKAFKEAADKLNRTYTACGFRWNKELRKVYQNAIDIAKSQRKILLEKKIDERKGKSRSSRFRRNTEKSEKTVDEPVKTEEKHKVTIVEEAEEIIEVPAPHIQMSEEGLFKNNIDSIMDYLTHIEASYLNVYKRNKKLEEENIIWRETVNKLEQELSNARKVIETYRELEEMIKKFSELNSE